MQTPTGRPAVWVCAFRILTSSVVVLPPRPIGPIPEALISFIKGDLHTVSHHRVIALVYQGENAVRAVRTAVGDTNPEKAAGGTIRGSFGRITTKNVFENVIHASGTPEEGEREISVWFKPEEIIPR